MAYSISMVVPMYNEEKNAERVVKSLDHGLSRITDDYEIIIVESGSTDNTKKIVDDLAEKYKNCIALHQLRKEGLGSAIRYGFRESKKDLVLYMDGDEPFSANEIKRAIPLIEGADAVIGFRLGKRESFGRWFCSAGYNCLVRGIFGFRVKDVNFSFKMLKRKTLNSISLRSNGFFIDAEMVAEMKKKGFKIKEMGIRYTPRKGGRSSVHIGPKLIFNMLKETFLYWLRW